MWSDEIKTRHIRRQLVERVLAKRTAGDIATEFSTTAEDVVDIYNSEINQRRARIEARFPFLERLMPAVPRRMFFKLLAISPDELRGVYFTSGVAGVRQLFDWPAGSPWPQGLTEAVMAWCEAPLSPRSIEPTSAWLYVAKPRQRLRVKAPKFNPAIGPSVHIPMPPPARVRKLLAKAARLSSGASGPAQRA